MAYSLAMSASSQSSGSTSCLNNRDTHHAVGKLRRNGEQSADRHDLRPPAIKGS
jgi:hypothetical protein